MRCAKGGMQVAERDALESGLSLCFARNPAGSPETPRHVLLLDIAGMGHPGRCHATRSPAGGLDSLSSGTRERRPSHDAGVRSRFGWGCLFSLGRVVGATCAVGTAL